MKAPERIYLQTGEHVAEDVEYIRGDVSEQFAKAAAFYARKSAKSEQSMPAWAKPIVEALKDLGYALSSVGAPDDEVRNTALELKWACARALLDAVTTKQNPKQTPNNPPNPPASTL
jgi:hypothetical protein